MPYTWTLLNCTIQSMNDGVYITFWFILIYSPISTSFQHFIQCEKHTQTHTHTYIKTHTHVHIHHDPSDKK